MRGVEVPERRWLLQHFQCVHYTCESDPTNLEVMIRSWVTTTPPTYPGALPYKLTRGAVAAHDLWEHMTDQ